MRNQGYAVEYWYLYGDKKHTEWVYMTPRWSADGNRPTLYLHSFQNPSRGRRDCKGH